VNSLYFAVALRARHRCEYCHAPELAFNFKFEIDHCDPRSRGGSNDLLNFALACPVCNLYKADWTNSQDDVSGQLVRLFNPRVDFWDSHFVIQSSVEIAGPGRDGSCDG
jgi:5-methylcytosine-specific restriction endonuclease McrA